MTKNRYFKIFSVLVGVMVLYLFVTAIQIISFSFSDSTRNADAIIVLGAAAYGSKPSPVFQERINHALFLYFQKKSPAIIFSGGKKSAYDFSEADVGKKFAIKHGVKKTSVITEEISRSTYQNINYSAQIGKKLGFESFIIVSDPLHMKRASIIAESLGIKYQSSPTKTSMYRSFKVRLNFLLHEIYNITHLRLYLVAMRWNIFHANL